MVLVQHDVDAAGRSRFGVHPTLGAKVAIICLVALVAAVTASFGVFHWQDWRADVRDCLAEHQQLASLLAPEIATAVETGDRQGLALALATARGEPDLTQLVWMPAQGPQRIFLARGGGVPPLAGDRVARRFPGGWVAVIEPVARDGRRIGSLRMVADARDIDVKLRRNAVTTIKIALVSAFAAALAVLVLTRRALRPLAALDHEMKALQQDHDFSRRSKVRSDDEFGRLALRFTSLLAELQAYDARLHATMAELTDARDSAEAATQMKSDFLANMSHEIRTPLNGVLGMAAVMATRPLRGDQTQSLEIIRTSGEALLALLNDILDFSKIEAGRLELNPAPFEIAAVMTSVHAAFEPLATEKALTLQVSISPAAEGPRLGDAGRIRQILFNLVSNSIKFTDHGGICVRVDVPSDDAGALRIEVADTGVGVQPEFLDRLFDKFAQADTSPTRRTGGTGLGLAICREIVTLMGGNIEFSGEAGRGSTFTVWLPAPRTEGETEVASDRELSEAASEDLDLRGLRVLAADDNATNRLVLGALLGALGVTARFVENGREAVDHWQANSLDLILMDIQMPVLDGVEAVREIRAIEQASQGAPTRIVALSANAMRHQVDSYLAAGMDDHLAKPLRIEALLKVLKEAAYARLASEPAIADR